MDVQICACNKQILTVPTATDPLFFRAFQNLELFI